VAVSPDGKNLASGSGDATVILWDMKAARELRRFQPLQQSASWGIVSEVKFSSDGKLLASAGWNNQIHLWNVKTAKELRPFGQGKTYIYDVAFSPDGKTVASASANAIRLWDIARAKEIYPFGGVYEGVSTVAFAPAGKHLALAEGQFVHYCEVRSGTKLRSFPGDEAWVKRVTFSPDGKQLATEHNNGTLGLWDLASGKKIRKWGKHSRLGEFDRDIHRVTPDLAKVVSWKTGERKQATVHINVQVATTGKKLLTFQRLGAILEPAAISPDGRWLGGILLDDKNLILVIDLTTGKEIRWLVQHVATVEQVAFSPDGRVLAAADKNGNMHLWEMATGQERRCFIAHAGKRFAFALSPDGRRMATWPWGDTIQLWDLATSKELGRLTGHRGPIDQAAFSPDGKRLASASEDTTVLLWDISDLVKGKAPAKARGNAIELNRAWATLGSRNAALAYRAMGQLEASAEEAIALARERMKPMEEVTPDRVARLLAELDSRRFSVRRKAMNDLEGIVDVVAPALRKALAKQPSLEVQRRLEKLLAGLNLPVTDPARLRALRGVEVLEFIGTAGACRVLKKLAKGTSAARLTQEAKAALKRLAWRSAAKP
jgi:WD40 repeat protein